MSFFSFPSRLLFFFFFLFLFFSPYPHSPVPPHFQFWLQKEVCRNELTFVSFFFLPKREMKRYIETV